jgi:hypothetical protein
MSTLTARARPWYNRWDMDFTNSSPWNAAAYNELKNLGPSSLGDWTGPNGEFQNVEAIFTP